jgi:hypothetical protein
MGAPGTAQGMCLNRVPCCDGLALTHEMPGKANALASGFAACRGDIVVMHDNDGSADPEGRKFRGGAAAGAGFAKAPDSPRTAAATTSLPSAAGETLCWLRS